MPVESDQTTQLLAGETINMDKGTLQKAHSLDQRGRFIQLRHPNRRRSSLLENTFTCHNRSVVDTAKMLRHVVPIATSGVVVALLFLGSVGC